MTMRSETRIRESALMPTYDRFPLTLVRGMGTRAWAEDGREYLDFAGALGVTAIGRVATAGGSG